MSSIRRSRKCLRSLIFSILLCSSSALQSPIARLTNQVKTGYNRRVAADPSFAAKSVTEVILAAGTQLAAEWNRRGATRLLPEIDFVLPGVLTAVFGKYYRYVSFDELGLKDHETRVNVKFLTVRSSVAESKPILWKIRLCRMFACST